MQLSKILLWVISVIVSYNGVCSLNILGVFPYPGKSHFFVFKPYLKELARRGHNVTVISNFPLEKPIRNYHDISLAGKIKVLESVIAINKSFWNNMKVGMFLTELTKRTCEVLLTDGNVQNLWKSEHNFDVVVSEMFLNDCTLGLAYKLGAPVVEMTSHVLMPQHYDRYGIQYHPAFTPHMFVDGGSKPSLSQRLERTFTHHFITILYKYTCRRDNQNQMQKYLDVPPIEELEHNIKLILVYTHFVISGSYIYPPNVIEVGGYHVAKPKELSEDLKKFIDESEHGIIYISFGSMLQAATTPRDKVEAIVGALSELPQKVVWKWDEKTLPGNPKNIYLSNWLPQNDILAHPNVLAFYSHCGLLGVTEAIYHGVPVIGMPVFGDQPGNAASVEESGLGVQIQLKDLTKENLLRKLKIVLDPEFRRKVKELSRVWHDRPSSPMDTAIYWTEFAARTKNFTFGSPASSVPLYQYLYLDIIFVALSVLFIALIILQGIVSLIKTLIFQHTPQKLKKN